VIQYSNGIAGIGLRGSRPDFTFSIDPSTLLLVNGRPSGSAGFISLSAQAIDRIKVLKGPTRFLIYSAA